MKIFDKSNLIFAGKLLIIALIICNTFINIIILKNQNDIKKSLNSISWDVYKNTDSISNIENDIDDIKHDIDHIEYVLY